LEHYKIIVTIIYLVSSCIAIDILFTTLVLKKHRSKLPDIWKQQTLKSYFAVVAASTVFSVFFVLVYLDFQNRLVEGKLIFTILFGFLIWVGFYLPSLRVINKPDFVINKKAAICLSFNSLSKVIIGSVIVLLSF
jgi:hypothetical protein